MEVAVMFGLSMDGTCEHVIIPPIELTLCPGDIVFITGVSGGGKSTLLKLIGQSLRAIEGEEPIPHQRPGLILSEHLPRLTDASLVDTLAKPEGEAAAEPKPEPADLDRVCHWLSQAGLNDAAVMLRKPDQLSEGQRHRLRLAQAMALAERRPEPWSVLLADEFGSSLDRTTAYALARSVKRWVSRSQPHHYRPGNPATMTRVLAVRDDKPSAGDRFASHQGVPRPVAVLVESLPSLSCRLRDEALGGRYGHLRPKPRSALLMQELRCISRVIVDPRYRGLSLAVRLVRHALATATTRYTEALAVMGRVSPFFERSGMAAYERPPLEPAQRAMDALRHIDVQPHELALPSRIEERIVSQPDARRQWISRELLRWYRTSAGRGAKRSPTLPEPTRTLPLDRLDAHPANSNVMPKALLGKLVSEIDRTGFYPPIIVRPIGERYQILDGHHRVIALKQLGLASVNAVVWRVDDQQALLLLATLNRMRGDDDPRKRAALLTKLRESMGVKEIAQRLPEDSGRVRKLLAIHAAPPSPKAPAPVDQMPAAGYFSGNDQINEAHPLTDSLFDDDKLILDLAHAEHDILSFAKAHRLSLGDLVDWACQAETRRTVAGLCVLADAQTQLLLSRYRLVAATRLIAQATAEDETLSPEQVRKACVDLLKTELSRAAALDQHEDVAEDAAFEALARAIEVGGAFDYLADSYFDRPGDAVVWANRGGGKTMLGAAATLLDLLFKPGIQVRILGGSLQQSEKMYEHLRMLLDQPLLREGGGVLAREPTLRKVILQNGSRVELLSGSQRAVRGTRVQVLRCDEAEEIDRPVWDAAQMVTRSAVCGGRVVPGRIEALSTMHKPAGLMSELTRAENRRLYRWNALDVVAKCPEARPCEGCPIWSDCLGMAKQATGHYPVQDLIDQRRRLSDRLWEAEMLCEKPITLEAVYPTFDPEDIVEEAEPWLAPGKQLGAVWFGGMDFGLRNETVILWGWALWRGPDAILHIAGEYIAKDRTVMANLEAADATAREHGLPGCAEFGVLAVDPAGNQRSGQTGESDVAVLRRAGCTVRTPQARIRLGLEAVIRRIDHGLLRIHPRCKGLIEAMQTYRYDPDRPDNETPLKEGADHACDALRYLVLAFDRGGGRLKRKGY
eukprot:g12535.t1